MDWFDAVNWKESGGLYGLIVLALFVLIFVDRVMVAKANAKVVNDLIQVLYQKGHLKDRRRSGNESYSGEDRRVK